MPVTLAGCWLLVIVSLVTEEMWSNGKISPWLVAGTSLCGSASDSRLAMLVITCTDNTHPHTLGQSYSYNSYNTHDTFSIKPKQTLTIKTSIRVDTQNSLEGHF